MAPRRGAARSGVPLGSRDTANTSLGIIPGIRRPLAGGPLRFGIPLRDERGERGKGGVFDAGGMCEPVGSIRGGSVPFAAIRRRECRLREHVGGHGFLAPFAL